VFELEDSCHNLHNDTLYVYMSSGFRFLLVDCLRAAGKAGCNPTKETCCPQPVTVHRCHPSIDDHNKWVPSVVCFMKRQFLSLQVKILVTMTIMTGVHCIEQQAISDY
jgi:hypothetical protein